MMHLEDELKDPVEEACKIPYKGRDLSTPFKLGNKMEHGMNVFCERRKKIRLAAVFAMKLSTVTKFVPLQIISLISVLQLLIVILKDRLLERVYNSGMQKSALQWRLRGKKLCEIHYASGAELCGTRPHLLLYWNIFV